METGKRRKRSLAGAALLLALAGVSGCATSLAPGRRPEWIANPKSDDSLCLYRVGHASGTATEAEARTRAYEDALAKISLSIRSEVKVAGSAAQVTSALEIRGAEIMSGCEYFEPGGGRWDGWVQVSYPLAEKQKILDRLKLGETLNALWASAKTAFHQSRFEQAKQDLLKIVADYEKALYAAFPVQEAQILLGDVFLEQKDFLQARQWYESAAKSDVNREAKERAEAKIKSLPAPPRAWPLHDRFGGRKVGLVCCVREGGAWKNAGDLAGILAGECREARLESADITGLLSAGDRAAFFNTRKPEAVIAAAGREGAGVVLTVFMDIDPKKRGTTEKLYDVETPAIDTRVYFQVLAVGGKTPVAYDGSFKEIAGTLSEASLARHAATILVQNYLVPKCPVVK